MADVDTLGTALARDWRLEVQTDTDEWTHVKGLRAVQAIFEGAAQDDSTIDSEGYGSQIVTGLSARITGSGFRQHDGGTPDPGQDFLREKGQKTGAANIIVARIYRTDELDDAYQMVTTVEWTDSEGSDPNALQEFSFTLSSRGKPEEIEKPDTEPVDPEDP